MVRVPLKLPNSGSLRALAAIARRRSVEARDARRSSECGRKRNALIEVDDILRCIACDVPLCEYRETRSPESRTTHRYGSHRCRGAHESDAAR